MMHNSRKRWCFGEKLDVVRLQLAKILKMTSPTLHVVLKNRIGMSLEFLVAP